MSHVDYFGSFVVKFRQRCGDRPPLFDYDDPAKYPELFAIENRTDVDHLNVPGAILFSKMLADRIAAQINRGAAPVSGPGCQEGAS
jgi:hypothetical protein